MKRIQLYLVGVTAYITLTICPSVMAQTPQADPQITALTAANTYQITWPGVAGRLYFVQFSTDLQTWTYAPEVRLGSGANISYGFSSNAPSSFVRLKYSVATNITSGAEGDFDGDGISNIEEVTYYGTDPMVSNDTDNDSYLNSDELAQGTDPNNSASTPFDPQNPPHPNLYVAPLSWWVENKFNDTIERLSIPINGQENPELATKRNRANALADGSYDLPYTSIQAAVNAASAGAVIQVAPGTYQEALDLSNRNVKIIGQRGSREETILEPPSTSAQGILLGANNTGATIVSGLTVKGTSGPAIRCSNGAAPVLHNLLLTNNQTGLEIDSSSPVLLGLVCQNSNGTGPTNAALRISGSGAAVRAAHCTIDDNVPQNFSAGQIQVSGSGCSLTMVNSIVSSYADRLGGQITLTEGATASVTYSSVRGGYTGTGNLDAASAADPQYDNRFLVGGLRRLLLTSPAVDRANPAALTGFHYFTRLDADGEARRRAYSIAPRVSRPDIGADEFVSRLTFPTKGRAVRGALRIYSEVDEASDVAFLGQLANGNARIAVINDEVIEWDQNSSGSFSSSTEPRKNVITFYEVSAADGSLLNPSEISIRRTPSEVGSGIKDQETRDPEGLAYDSTTATLYLVNSQTKVNRYRDCEPTTYDPLVDPPSNDYDPRRNVMLSVPIGATNLLPSGPITYYDARDGAWQPVAANRRSMDDFANGGSTVSPVGYDSPNGLVATLRAQLQTNQALKESVRNTGVMIAINTAPKFGNPVNGITYQPGAGLPYGNTSGLGGPAATAGWVLHLPTNQNSADFPYYRLDNLPAAGQQITGYKTTVGGAVVNIAANTTYYFKAWAYSGNGAARTYGRGLEAEAKTTSLRPVRVNEIFGAGEGTNSVAPDSMEFFNPSGIPVKLDGLQLFTQNIPSGVILPDNSGAAVNIPARGHYRIQRGNITALNPAARSTIQVSIGNGSDLGRLVDNDTETDYYFFTRNQPKPSSNTAGPADEGRVWDGGPAGRHYDFVDKRFENEGAYFRDGAATHPKSLGNAATSVGEPNHTQAQGAAKFLQATHNHVTQTGIFLHYANLGEELAVWRYSPKQQDFHPISVEGLAVRNQNEFVIGLRSPLVNRTTGNAYAFVFSNAGNQFLPAAGWTAPAAGLQGAPRQLNLNGQGIRSIQWCPQLNNGTGAYLIIGGSANGGPLKNETTRQVFSLYRWDHVNAQPVRVVADLSAFAVRPEGVNIITLNGTPRVIFVEDRYKAEGYDTQNAIHWPLAELNLQ